MANLNYFPVTSPEWLQEKLDTITPTLEKQLTEMAAARGLNPNDPMVKKQIEDEIDKYRQQYMAEQSQYGFTEQENEKARQSQEKMSKEQANAAERASMWQGLGMLGAMPILGNNKTLIGEGLKGAWSGGKKLFTPVSSSIPAQTTPQMNNLGLTSNSLLGKPFTSTNNLDLGINPVSSNLDLGINPVSSSQWSNLQKIGIPALGSGLGYAFNPSKGGLQSALAGGLTSGASPYLGAEFTPYAGLGTLLGSWLAPKSGLFSKGNNFWQSLLSLGLSSSPAWLGSLI